MMTAYVALQEAQQLGSVSHHLDQGCGIGSVLMMLAWGLPEARCTGVEAQECSVALARRSLAYNGAEGRCRVIHGDLRAPLPADLPPTFPLITGTPPYIPLGRGNVSERIQKGPCCFETRGGIEDYCAAAAGRLQEQGLFVVCAGVQGQPAHRSWDAARAAGLKIVRQVEVVPRDGKPALMHVFAMQRQDTGSRPQVQQDAFETFLVREADGRLSQHMHEARRFMGLPPSKQ
jgi:tRNA1Val (adenine37-N6)-methyltransferase